MQDDGFEPARYLDRADGIAGVDDVGRVRACAEWLFARLEPERRAALEAVAGAVRLRADGPGLGEETLDRVGVRR